MEYKGTPLRVQELRELLDGVEAAAYMLGAASATRVSGAHWTECERILAARRHALHVALHELVIEMQFPPPYAAPQTPPTGGE